MTYNYKFNTDYEETESLSMKKSDRKVGKEKYKKALFTLQNQKSNLTFIHITDLLMDKIKLKGENNGLKKFNRKSNKIKSQLL